MPAQSGPSVAAPTASSAPTSGVRAEFLNELKIQEDKFVQLAQATPADKYTWRPAEGVRSIGEVYMHVATANYNLPHVFGVAPPPGFKAQSFEKSTTDKARIVETLKDSFAHMRRAVLNMPDADVEKQLDFSAKSTYRGVMMFIIRHGAEHLGQSIAYARMNGIVPPWTEEQQKQKKATVKPKAIAAAAEHQMKWCSLEETGQGSDSGTLREIYTERKNGEDVVGTLTRFGRNEDLPNCCSVSSPVRSWICGRITTACRSTSRGLASRRIMCM